MTQAIQQQLNSQFADKNIVILGVGITGLSCARFLHRYQIPFAVNDSRATPISPGEFSHTCGRNKLVLGHWDFELIAKAQVLIVSPGIDLQATGIEQVIAADCDVIGDVELYCRLTTTKVIAVTGSNGKSTVVSMLNFVGNALGYNTLLAGNIGLPILDQIEQDDVDFVILELSSFQLETIESMRTVAATVLNVSDDHLDRHKTIENYGRIKRRIYQQCQRAVVNRADVATVPELTKTRTISFGLDAPAREQFGLLTAQGGTYLACGDESLVELNELPLKGHHNALNYLAVLALGTSANWPMAEMLTALKRFQGLAHRCEVIASDDDICWINDSKATNVGATIAAIAGLAVNLQPEQQLILIAGGDGKGADFSPLSPVLQQDVEQLITIGKDGEQIAALWRKQAQCNHSVDSLPAAVSLAKQLAKPGDMVLLSPACASLDMFSNYVERGVVFIKSVLMSQGGKR